MNISSQVLDYDTQNRFIRDCEYGFSNLDDVIDTLSMDKIILLQVNSQEQNMIDHKTYTSVLDIPIDTSKLKWMDDNKFCEPKNFYAQMIDKNNEKK